MAPEGSHPEEMPWLPHTENDPSHNNAHPILSSVTMQPHPPYSPELAPRDFHLAGPLKKHLEQKYYIMMRCANGCKHRPDFFSVGIEEVVYCWDVSVALAVT
jgi:hypothetical protein